MVRAIGMWDRYRYIRTYVPLDSAMSCIEMTPAQRLATVLYSHLGPQRARPLAVGRSLTGATSLTWRQPCDKHAARPRFVAELLLNHVS